MRKKYFTEEERKIVQREFKRKYYQNHKKEMKLKIKKYDEKHKEQRKKYNKNYRKTHLKERRIYQNNRIQTDIDFRLSKNLRNRLRMAIKNNQRMGSAVKDLGCSVSELKTYLESKFQKGMTWDNWSRTGWHIDHIIPLDFFNLQNKEEFLKACHYTNLQPLWAEENTSKKNKFT
jgi:hypothetical protein